MWDQRNTRKYYLRRLHQIRVFAVNAHPVKAFLAKKGNSLEQGEMSMVEAKNALASPPNRESLR
jgi:hypothetical protein